MSMVSYIICIDIVHGALIDIYVFPMVSMNEKVFASQPTVDEIAHNCTSLYDALKYVWDIVLLSFLTGCKGYCVQYCVWAIQSWIYYELYVVSKTIIILKTIVFTRAWYHQKLLHDGPVFLLSLAVLTPVTRD